MQIHQNNFSYNCNMSRCGLFDDRWGLFDERWVRPLWWQMRPAHDPQHWSGLFLAQSGRLFIFIMTELSALRNIANTGNIVRFPSWTMHSKLFSDHSIDESSHLNGKVIWTIIININTTINLTPGRGRNMPLHCTIILVGKKFQKIPR